MIFLCTAGTLTHAQVLKSGLRTLHRPGAAAIKASETARKITESVALQRPLLRKPVLTNLEPNIHRFIFTVSPRGVTAGPKGSGFVFAERLRGKTVLWGASAAQTVKNMGTDITVTFHLNDRTVSFPATVELAGHEAGLNAALIKLPEEAAQVALPFTLATETVSPQESVFTFGFNNGDLKKTIRSVLVPGTERLVADLPLFSAPKSGLDGSVVLNGKGQAVGIELGGYDLKSAVWPQQMSSFKPYRPILKVSRVSEIVPVQRLNTLLREYHTAESGSRVLLLGGIRIGKIGVEENIDHLEVLYKDGSSRILERSPLWELQFMERAVPELQEAQQVNIVINKADGTQFTYQIDLITHTAIRKD